MTDVSMPTPDLPVIWWVFWLAAMAVAVFSALVWWLTRAALREDAAPLADGDEEEPEGTRPGLGDEVR